MLNKPERKFWKNQHNQKTTMPTKRIKFYKLNLPETLQKENEPILRTYTTDHDQNRSHATKPIKTYADQNKAKNLEANFSDSTKPT